MKPIFVPPTLIYIDMQGIGQYCAKLLLWWELYFNSKVFEGDLYNSSCPKDKMGRIVGGQPLIRSIFLSLSWESQWVVKLFGCVIKSDFKKKSQPKSRMSVVSKCKWLSSPKNDKSNLSKISKSQKQQVRFRNVTTTVWCASKEVSSGGREIKESNKMLL